MINLTYLPSEEGFLGLPETYNKKPEHAEVVVIPYGLEASVSYEGGTGKGPSAILKASHQVELFDEEFWCEPFRTYGISTLEEQNISTDLPTALEKLEHTVEQVINQKCFPLILGGEHALTAGSVRPFAKHYENLVVLHFDAHADLRDGYEGERYSHAAAMRRVLDYENIQLISIGIRNISTEEVPFLQENSDRISIYWAKDRKNWHYEEIVAALKNKPFYISFDLDGFDSSLMPATGTPEPGGLFFQESLDILKLACQAGTCVGADIVELSPIKGFHACDFLAAKLAYKILNYVFLKNYAKDSS